MVEDLQGELDGARDLVGIHAGEEAIDLDPNGSSDSVLARREALQQRRLLMRTQVGHACRAAMVGESRGGA